jgi:hypothetical protein
MAGWGSGEGEFNRMTDSDETRLADLFQRYRESCPEIEPGADFMPGVWRKIELRRSFWAVFSHFGRIAAPACAALCLVFLLLNLASASDSRLAPTYADALAADHTAETTYYAEAIRTGPDADFAH